MELAQRIDEHGKPAWIALMILSFIVFWPIGLALLAYLIWSGRMGCRKQSSAGRWHYYDEARKHSRRGWSKRKHAGTSGNAAFDEYKEATLRRLEDEQSEFHDYLERLRKAKDKAEFDAFLADRETNRSADAPDDDSPVIDENGNNVPENRPQP